MNQLFRIKFISVVCFVFLMGVLAGCFRVAPPSTPEEQADNQPAVSVQGSLPLVLQSYHYQGPVYLEFAAPMDKNAVQRAFNVTPGNYNAVTNPATFTKLQLTSMCNGKWRARNPNGVPIKFTWDVYNTSEKGAGVVPANADVFFYSSTGSKTVRLFVGSQQQQVKASNPAACTDTPFTFAWSGDSKSVTVTPSQPLAPNSDYTIILSEVDPKNQTGDLGEIMGRKEAQEGA